MNPPKRVKLKKPAPVRQTLTSIYRMAKLNPLLQQESDDPKIKKTSLPPAVTGGRYKASEASSSHSSLTSNKTKAKKSMMCSKEHLKVPEHDGHVSKKKPRRSLSAEHFQRKHSKLSRNEQMVKNTEMTQSLEDIPLSSSEKKVTFMTPMSNFNSFSNSVARNSTPCSNNILRHLNRWLQRNGKSKSAYYHLKYFAIDLVEEDDENEICISPETRSEIENASTLYSHRLENVLKDALDDLNHLTQSGYPLVQCEKWLAVIRKRYRTIEEQWQYWVCRASIEENRGNLSSAVECYQTAVIKGAKAEYIEDCLDQLFKKFMDMNSANDGDETAKMIDLRNIFKTYIVKFVVHKCSLKTNEKKERVTKRQSNKF